MLSDHLCKLLETNLDFSPTQSQHEAIKHISRFIIQTRTNQILILKGYAGTGKTTLVNALIKTLEVYKLHYILMAPTGRAAKVLSAYTKKNAYTIHKTIYRQKLASDGLGKFELNFNKHKDTIFIIDEASMIGNQSLESSIFGSGNLLKDLIDFIKTGKQCRLILIGDIAQLPPVGLDISPALNPVVIKSYNFDTDEYTLTDVIRQYRNSGILFNATVLRNMIESKQYHQPNFYIRDFDDVIPVGKNELIEEIETAYGKYGTENVIIITRSNKSANYYNQGIRNRILFRDKEICSGDRLMVVKNSYYWLEDTEQTSFIANGDIIELFRINKIEEKYGFRFADAIVTLPDYNHLEIHTKLLLDTLQSETASLSTERQKELYFNIAQSYPQIKNKKKLREYIINNPYFNAIQIKFAYAVTCHKAQGGQWDAVFIDQGYFAERMITKEYLRWLYTAFTRPVKKIYLINFIEQYMV